MNELPMQDDLQEADALKEQVRARYDAGRVGGALLSVTVRGRKA